MIELNDEWLDSKIEEIKGMQLEIEKRLEQLRQQQLMNLGAITMLNQIRNGVPEQVTKTKKNGDSSE